MTAAYSCQILACSARLDSTQTAWIDPGTQPTIVNRILINNVTPIPSFMKILTGGKRMAKTTLRRLMILSSE